jgi:hypothetical protein
MKIWKAEDKQEMNDDERIRIIYMRSTTEWSDQEMKFWMIWKWKRKEDDDECQMKDFEKNESDLIKVIYWEEFLDLINELGYIIMRITQRFHW